MYVNIGFRTRTSPLFTNILNDFMNIILDTVFIYIQHNGRDRKSFITNDICLLINFFHYTILNSSDGTFDRSHSNYETICTTIFGNFNDISIAQLNYKTSVYICYIFIFCFAVYKVMYRRKQIHPGGSDPGRRRPTFRIAFRVGKPGESHKTHCHVLRTLPPH